MRHLLVLSLALVLGCKTGATAVLGGGIGVAATGAIQGIVVEAKKPEGSRIDHTLTGALVGTGWRWRSSAELPLGCSSLWNRIAASARKRTRERIDRPIVPSRNRCSIRAGPGPEEYDDEKDDGEEEDAAPKTKTSTVPKPMRTPIKINR